METKYSNIASEQKNPEIEKTRGKKYKLLAFLIKIFFTVLILVMSKDVIFSQYNKFMGSVNVNKDKPAEKKEESNFLNDVYFNKIDRADDAKRKADLINIRFALEFYFSENGNYPISTSAVKLNDPSSTAYKEIIKYAKDPSNLKDPEFYYSYKSDGKSFEISARLESDRDSECKISDAGICIYRISSTLVK
ncbi:MAG: hypothetical protein WA063_01640 [Minisyncoccia bacterium]